MLRVIDLLCGNQTRSYGTSNWNLDHNWIRLPNPTATNLFLKYIHTKYNRTKVSDDQDRQMVGISWNIYNIWY